jgi:hypothetical protein
MVYAIEVKEKSVLFELAFTPLPSGKGSDRCISRQGGKSNDSGK